MDAITAMQNKLVAAKGSTEKGPKAQYLKELAEEYTKQGLKNPALLLEIYVCRIPLSHIILLDRTK